MLSAVVLINCERNQINSVAEQLTEIHGISEVFSVAGRHDLVAILRVSDNDALADLVTNRMLQVNGITESETLISFKVHSKHDLEAMFAIGLDE